MNKVAIISITCILILGFSAFVPGYKPGYKNLKILPQDITKEQLDSVMKHFSLSLGVRCNYCHARTEDNTHLDFASDSKGEKNVARKMMLMTDSINNTYFNRAGAEHSKMQMITCYTCHRGDEQPVKTIPDSLLNRRH